MRIRFLVFGLWLLSATLPTASAATADLHTIAQGVDNHYNHLKSFQAEFTELYRGNGIDRIESGTLWLKKPRKMRWEYRSPREKLFVSNGQDAWFYVPGERQARREPFKKLEDIRSPLGFLLGKTKLEKELKGLSIAMDVKPMQAGDTVLRGTPKGMEDRVSQVLVEVTPESHIFRIVLQGTDDAVTEYRFTEVKEDLPLADNKFRFEPPAGVETIEGEIGQ